MCVCVVRVCVCGGGVGVVLMCGWVLEGTALVPSQLGLGGGGGGSPWPLLT